MATIQVKDASGVTQTVPVRPSNGQATAANSQPVVLASDQSTLTVTVSNLPSTQPVSGPVTDAQIRATALPVTVTTLPLPLTASTSANQLLTNTALSNIGVTSDAAATTDNGTFSILSFIKRGLANWTTLLAKMPSLVSGRMPVDGSGVTQPISGTITANAGTGFSSLALETGGNLAAILSKITAAPALASNQPAINADGGSLVHITNHVTTQAVTGPLTAAELRSFPLAISGNVSLLDTVTVLGNVSIIGSVATSLPGGGSETNRSGYTVVANTALTIMPSNIARKHFEIQNLSTTNILWIRKDGSVATIGEPGSFPLAMATATTPGGFYSGKSINSVSVISAIISHPFSAVEIQ